MPTLTSIRRLFGLAVLLSWGTLALAQHDGSGRQLEQRLAPEERARLHRELHDYSDRAYPDRQRLQLRREQMHERQQRRLESNGGLTRDEARRHAPWLERRFEEIDRDGDGLISEEEVRAARRRER